jgi:hypothetical protein
MSWRVILEGFVFHDGHVQVPWGMREMQDFDGESDCELV